MKKIKRCKGDVVQIALEDEKFCYGLILEEPLIAFFDANTKSPLDVVEVGNLPVLFKLFVMNNAITKGRWKVIGSIEIDEEFNKPVKFFKQDPISKKLTVYCNEKETPATYDECLKLEKAAVWSAEHVESRLKDHFAGVPNMWVQSLSPKPEIS